MKLAVYVGISLIMTRILMSQVYWQTDTHPFNAFFSGTTWVSWYQKGKTILDFTETRDSEWQWHQLGHMQVCTLLQADIHASTPLVSFYRPDALPDTQPTVSKYWQSTKLLVAVCYVHKYCYILITFLYVTNITTQLTDRCSMHL